MRNFGTGKSNYVSSMDSSHRKRNCFSPPKCPDRLRATQTPIQWVKSAVSSTDVKMIDYSHPCSVEVKK
jgi:hypothetical protein